MNTKLRLEIARSYLSIDLIAMLVLCVVVLWFNLIAGIICILVGALVWSAFGNIYTTVNGAGVVSDGNLSIYVKVSDRPSVKEGMDITVNGHKTVVREISA